MAEIEEEVTFYTKSDQVKMTTSTNGERLCIKGFHFSPEQAASMAWLINMDNSVQLEFQVKIKDT